MCEVCEGILSLIVDKTPLVDKFKTLPKRRAVLFSYQERPDFYQFIISCNLDDRTKHLITVSSGKMEIETLRVINQIPGEDIMTKCSNCGEKFNSRIHGICPRCKNKTRVLEQFNNDDDHNVNND